MAAGPKTIALEWLRQAEQAIYALDHARGCDLFNLRDWEALSTSFSYLKRRLEGMIETLPDGTAEEISKQRYGKGES